MSAAVGAAHLPRNSACHQCRKKKLKCDARQPHCSPCLKAHRPTTDSPSAAWNVGPPPGPTCTWDDKSGWMKEKRKRPGPGAGKRKAGEEDSESTSTTTPKAKQAKLLGSATPPMDHPSYPPIFNFHPHLTKPKPPPPPTHPITFSITTHTHANRAPLSLLSSLRVGINTPPPPPPPTTTMMRAGFGVGVGGGGVEAFGYATVERAHSAPATIVDEEGEGWLDVGARGGEEEGGFDWFFASD